MDRRTFLSSLGATTIATSLAGCSSGDGNTSSGEDPTTTEQPDPEDMQPIPGAGKVHSISNISTDSISITFSDVDWPREVTLELYAEVATTDTPAGGWGIYTYDTNGAKRPALNYSDNERFIAETTGARRAGGSEDRATVSFPHEELPAGVPIQYQVYLQEHTLDNGNGPRRHVGTTEQAVRKPDTDEYIVAPTGDRAARAFEGYHEYDAREDEDGNRHVTLVGSTNNTKYHTPLYDHIPNRTNSEVGRNQYERGAFERLWSIDYTITNEEYEYAREHNKIKYIGPYGDDDELSNVRRMFETYFDGGDGELAQNSIEPLQRIAEQFGERAEALGLTTPEEKLRFLMDFVQWMPYEHDDERRERGDPRVQHPVTTLARCKGDCEDKTVLLAALAYQDPFPDYVMHFYQWRNPAENVAAHFGLAVKNDLFTVETGGPTARNIDNWDAEEGDYTYFEATYPAPMERTDDSNRDLRIIRMPFPGY